MVDETVEVVFQGVDEVTPAAQSARASTEQLGKTAAAANTAQATGARDVARSLGGARSALAGTATLMAVAFGSDSLVRMTLVVGAIANIARGLYQVSTAARTAAASQAVFGAASAAAATQASTGAAAGGAAAAAGGAATAGRVAAGGGVAALLGPVGIGIAAVGIGALIGWEIGKAIRGAMDGDKEERGLAGAPQITNIEVDARDTVTSHRALADMVAREAEAVHGTRSRAMGVR